jgi:hypothetical protein
MWSLYRRPIQATAAAQLNDPLRDREAEAGGKATASSIDISLQLNTTEKSSYLSLGKFFAPRVNWRVSI